MIRCCLIFQSTIHLMLYWGIFPFRLRFIDLHQFACPSPLMRCMLGWWFTIILSWSPSEVSLGPFSQAHTFRHLDVIMLFLQGYASLIYGSDLVVNMKWLELHTWWWMIWCPLIFWPTIHLIPYWGIFPFWLRFIDLHWFAWSSSFMRYMSSW